MRHGSRLFWLLFPRDFFPSYTLKPKPTPLAVYISLPLLSLVSPFAFEPIHRKLEH